MITCLMLIIEFTLLFASLQENIVYPHLKSNYNQVCMVKRETPEQKPSMASKLSQLFQLFSLGNDGKQTHTDEL